MGGTRAGRRSASRVRREHPLVNGYSDYIPPDFLANVHTLAPFPSRDAFKILEPGRVRYALFHMYGYNAANRRDCSAG
jgi:hypothetical protein